MTLFVNLTPHVVRIYLGRAPDPLTDMHRPSQWLIIPQSGEVAHVDQAGDYRHAIGGVRVMRWTIGDSAGIPEPQEGVILIVSSLVARELRRPDCVAPDTKSSAIFARDGQLYAVRRFQQWVSRGGK